MSDELARKLIPQVVDNLLSTAHYSHNISILGGSILLRLSKECINGMSILGLFVPLARPSYAHPASLVSKS
jgi:hypothetical protein